MSVLSFVSRACVRYLSSIRDWLFPHYKDISGEIILVTGGGRGLGRKITLHLARCKPKHIVIWGRNEVYLQNTTEEVEHLGVSASYHICDVSNREQIYQKAQELQQSIGDVTLLVNNAGVVFGGTVLDCADEDVVKTLQVNALAHIWTIKAFLPAMMTANHGHIVCISSVLGLLGLKGTGPYTSSKFAITGIMESLASELEEYLGIYVSTIHPYTIANDMFAGVKIRFPKLFPALSEDYVAVETVKAILTNRKQLNLPAYFHSLLLLRSLMPVICMPPAFKFFGLDKTMDAIGQSDVSSHSSAPVTTSHRNR